MSPGKASGSPSAMAAARGSAIMCMWAIASRRARNASPAKAKPASSRAGRKAMKARRRSGTGKLLSMRGAQTRDRPGT